MEENRDRFSKSQNHFNPKFKREMGLVKNYQHMMDKRLSKAKETVQVGDKVYKNSNTDMQLQH